MFHYIANFTDGVSLEMNKWKKVFEGMGHKVFLCAGKYGSSDETCIEEMYHHRPDSRLLNFNTFQALRDYQSESTYRSDLYRLAGIIEEKLYDFIVKNEINFLIPQNVWSVAANPSVAIALTRIMRQLELPALAHNHDFYFERTDGFRLTCSTAVELVDLYYPPRDPLAKHVVINSLAQRKLLERKGIPSSIVPNTFDFDEPAWKIDDYNYDFRERIGLRETDVIVLQATRIVTRKGIELAIDFVKALNSPERKEKIKKFGFSTNRQFLDDSRIVLVFAGYAMDDATGNYKNMLSYKANELGIDILFIEDFIGERRTNDSGTKKYSLWDSYVHADIVTYPSQWEGWGNQLLEAIRAKLPIVMYEYPVYIEDIKEKGLRIVSLGKQVIGRDKHGLVKIEPRIIEKAADEAVEIITNPGLCHDIVEHNYKVGNKYFSMDALHIYLEQLIQSFDINKTSKH